MGQIQGAGRVSFPLPMTIFRGATGSTAPTALIEAALTGVCGVLSLRHFRLASWCSLSLSGWSPKNPARRISPCSGRLGGAAAADDVADFFLVFHRALPDLQRIKHKPDQALGHREVFCFFLVIFRGATGSTAPTALIEAALTGVCGVLSLRHFRLASWCSLSLSGWSPKNPARRISPCSGRLGGAAAADDVADFFLVIFRGATGSTAPTALIEAALTGVCGVLSLRHFRLASWCSLSLSGWSPKNPARRISPCSGRLGGAAAADDVADFFLVIFRGATGSTAPTALIEAALTGVCGVLSLRHFRLASWCSLSLSGWSPKNPARRISPCSGRLGGAAAADDVADFFLVIFRGATGSTAPTALIEAALTGVCGVLSLRHFRLASWCSLSLSGWSPKNPARRISPCSGRLGGAAAADDVADFFLVIFRGATGSTAPTALIEAALTGVCGVLSLRHFRLASWCSLSLSGWSPKNPARRISPCSGRLGGAAAADDVADFFLVIFRGATGSTAPTALIEAALTGVCGVLSLRHFRLASWCSLSLSGWSPKNPARRISPCSGRLGGAAAADDVADFFLVIFRGATGSTAPTALIEAALTGVCGVLSLRHFRLASWCSLSLSGWSPKNPARRISPCSGRLGGAAAADDVADFFLVIFRGATGSTAPTALIEAALTGVCGVLSLRHFRLASWCSLSLSGWSPKNPARRISPCSGRLGGAAAADDVADFFLVIFRGATGSTAPTALIEAALTGVCGVLSLRHFRLASWCSLSLSGWSPKNPARRISPCSGRLGGAAAADDVADFFLVIFRGATGSTAPTALIEAALTGVCGVLSLRHFRLASWCSLSLSGWSPKNPARRISPCSGRLGGAAAADDVADFFLVIFRGATGSTAPTALIEAALTGVCGVLSLRHFRLASWCSLSLSGWSPKNPARRISPCSGRLGGAAAADDVADFFLVIFRGATGSTAPTALIEAALTGVCGVLSLRHFRLASWCSLSLSGWSPKNPARRISPCSGRLGGAAAADDVADFFLVIFRGATGSTAPTALIEAALTGVCGVLSLRHFRLASWCSLSLSGWSPKNPARRISPCSGRLGGAAAADDVADFFLVIFRGATGSTAPTALIEAALTGVCGVLSLRHFRLASWCSLSLSGWSPKNPARRIKQ